MSEEYPLLHEDNTEEDKFVPFYHRRTYSMRVKGRARNHVKGAAALIKQWPEYWTTLLAYWWIGLGMIAIISFIIYNTLFSFAMFHPTAHPKPVKSLNGIIKQYKNSVKPYDVFMHVFVNETEAVDLNKYFPYIDIVSKEYKAFKFHFIVVLNDTNEQPNFSDEMNNELALNTILTNSKNNHKIDTNIYLEHVTLSRYLHNSPIQKYWRSLPKQFVRFLVRAVSVWERGGIAVNPSIFTPQSPNPIYIEKLKNILQNFKITDFNKNIYVKSLQKSTLRKTTKAMPTPNNILDILNEFENEEMSSTNPDPPMLEAAESRNIIEISKNITSVNDGVNIKEAAVKSQLAHFNNEVNISKEKGERKSLTHQGHKNGDNVPKILPLFLNYLFHKDSITNSSNETEIQVTPRIRKSITSKVTSTSKSENGIKKSKEKFKPMIVKAKGIVNDSTFTSTVVGKSEENYELTVDLKGNLIATQTPCHAFLGDIFTNAIHHDETETLTDFIIKELSIFCKGLLTSCVGIDVILI